MRKNNKYILIHAMVEGEQVSCCINTSNVHKAIAIFKNDIMERLCVNGFAFKYDKRDKKVGQI